MVDDRLHCDLLATANELALRCEAARHGRPFDPAAEDAMFAFLRSCRDELAAATTGEAEFLKSFPCRFANFPRLADEGLLFVLEAIATFNGEGFAGERLPAEFFLMRNVEAIWLSGTCLSSVSGDYASLPRLQTFVMEEVWALERLDDPSVAEAPAIESVDLNACGLTAYPKQLHRAGALKHLSVSYCHDGHGLTRPFAELPAGLADLRSLRNLKLAGIGLSRLPEELFQMDWLESLVLLSNEIPEEQQERLRSALPTTGIHLD